MLEYARVIRFKIIVTVSITLFMVSTALADQTETPPVSIGNLTLRASILYNAEGVPILVEHFSTTDPIHHSVICADAYRDAKYQLTSSTGAIMEISPAAGSMFTVPWAGYPIKNSCNTVRASVKQMRAKITSLFPGLKPGRYRLGITFAPRGTLDRARLSPLDVMVGAAH